jgi:hypothetical protein
VSAPCRTTSAERSGPVQYASSASLSISHATISAFAPSLISPVTSA